MIMPEELTTDDTFLSKSQWENNFDLIKDLDETTAIGYYPKIAERILLDDTSIDPSPINSRINSQDIEMTSKSNFIEKNPAPSVVVVPAKKKRKMVNVTNHQQEDMSLEVKDGKNSLFRKSVAGKENQNFDVAYAESEASNLTSTTVDTPAKHFPMTDDSLDLTLTDAIVNVKKSMFMRKKSSVNLQQSFNGKDAAADESDLQKETNCNPVSMSTTEAALHYPEDDNEQSVNKSPENSEVSHKNISEMDEDLEAAEDDIDKTMEKDSEQECSMLSEATTISFASPKKSSLPFNRPRRTKKNFHVDPENTDTVSSSSKNVLKSQTPDFGKEKNLPGVMLNDISLNSIVSSQEETSSRPNVKRSTLFSKRNTKTANFTVNFEETESGSNNVSSVGDSTKQNDVTRTTGNDEENGEISEGTSLISAPSSQEETSSRPNVKRSTLFSKRSTNSANFKINFEETESESNNVSSVDNSVKENDTSKTPKNNEGNEDISEEESPFSQEEPLSQPIKKRTTLFNKRKTKNADFKVNFEETGSGSNNVTSVDDSIKENDSSKASKNNTLSESAIISQKAKSAISKRKSLFVRRSKRTKEKSFNVQCEQTTSGSDSISNQSKNEASLNVSTKSQSSAKKSKPERKTILFQKKNKEEEDPFNVSCNETNSFRNVSKNDSLRRAAIFGKRRKKSVEDTFDVACEESQAEQDLEESSIPADTQGSFNQKSLELSPMNISPVTNKSHEKSLEESPISSVRMASPRSSLRNSSYSFSDRSKISSRNVTVIDKTEKSIKKTPNISNRTLNSSLAQSSFNDDNLNGWMSDHSDESEKEDQPETVPTSEIPPPLPTIEKPGPSNNVQKVIDWEAKFQRILEKAEKGEDIRRKKSLSFSKENKKIVPNKHIVKKSPNPRLKKPAPYATKRLYKFLIDKLQPKFGIDATIRAEELVVDICETVKIVTRRKTYQKKLINDLKKDMARLGIVETTWDFYNFVRDYLPESFRNKSIPRIQPFTCEVWPPRDVADPFEKIL